MSDFPTIVYRCPGPHFGPAGTTYESIGVANLAQLEQSRSEGYFSTLQEAVDNFKNPPKEKENIIDDSAPPTRDELVKKAEELGIDVDLRWGDKTLLAKIEQKLAGK
jgi:hypothetical protein